MTVREYYRQQYRQMRIMQPDFDKRAKILETVHTAYIHNQIPENKACADATWSYIARSFTDECEYSLHIRQNRVNTMGHSVYHSILKKYYFARHNQIAIALKSI